MANVSEQDHELLSAYVDGMLDEQERLALEARLHSEPDLLRALTALYLTLAMVKQLPTLTAPRNFTLKDPPARWLVFPTTTVFSALSAAAATFLVVIGFFLLTRGMGAGSAMLPPAAGESNEVALMSNQTSQSQSPVPTISSTQILRDMQVTPQETETVVTMMFAATQGYEAPPTGGGAGGGITIETTIDTFAVPETPTLVEPIEPEAFDTDGVDGESAANTAMMQPLSTGTPLPTISIADAAPAQFSTDEESASDTSEARFFTPSDDEQQESANVEDTIIAQEPTLQLTSDPTPTLPPRASATIAPMTAEAVPVTIEPTVAPAPIPPSRAMTPLLGIALVVGGALLFGIAFMTAVTRRGDRRSGKDQ